METSNVLKVEPRLKVDSEYDMLESKNVHHYFGVVDSANRCVLPIFCTVTLVPNLESTKPRFCSKFPLFKAS